MQRMPDIEKAQLTLTLADGSVHVAEIEVTGVSDSTIMAQLDTNTDVREGWPEDGFRVFEPGASHATWSVTGRFIKPSSRNE